MTNANAKMRLTANAGITVSFRRRVDLFISYPLGQRVATPTYSDGATLATRTATVNPVFAKFDALRLGPQPPFVESPGRPKIPPFHPPPRLPSHSCFWHPL